MKNRLAIFLNHKWICRTIFSLFSCQDKFHAPTTTHSSKITKLANHETACKLFNNKAAQFWIETLLSKYCRLALYLFYIIPSHTIRLTTNSYRILFNPLVGSSFSFFPPNSFIEYCVRFIRKCWFTIKSVLVIFGCFNLDLYWSLPISLTT